MIAKLLAENAKLRHVNAHLTATKAGEQKEEPNKGVVGEADNEEAEEVVQAEVGRRGALSTSGLIDLPNERRMDKS